MPENTTRQIGKYQIQAELGRGGFGTVYKAYDPTVGRLVAIKVLTAAADKNLLTRFRNEAGAAGNLHHKNIVTIYDFGEHAGLPYIVMEFLEGEDLQQVIASRKPLSLLDKVSIMLQVADGLQCAHRAGVVHRDVKPQNVRILLDGTVKIMDFGIARLIADAEGTRLTRQGHVIGTLLYMAPEQVLGGEADFLCDIFAYGITYYELLTGKHPFDAPNPRAIFYRLTIQDPEPVRNLVPECPPALENIISRALHKDREFRYQSLREVQFDTEPILIELQQERAASLVTTANQLYDEGQLDAAQAILNEAFDLDPANRAARDVRERIQKQLLQQLIGPKVRALLAKGDEAVANRAFEQGIETFESALRLDRDNVEVQQKLARARNLLELSREATRLISEARRQVAKNNLDAALRILPETLELDPQNADAQQLFDEVRKEIARREKQRQRNETMRQAKHRLQENRFDDAAKLVQELDEEYWTHPDVESLVALIREKKHAYERQQALQQELSLIRELLGSGEFATAVDRLEALRAAYPEEPEPMKLLVVAHRELAAQQQREAIERLEAEVEHLIAEGRFEYAVSAIDEMLSHYPGAERLFELRHHTEAAWEREVVQQSREHLQQGQPERAIEILEAALQQHPQSEQLLAALATARNEAIESLCREARIHLNNQEFGPALEKVQAYGDDERVSELRHEILAAEQLQQGQPERAVEILEAALQHHPQSEPLLTALATARNEAIESLCREARIHLNNQEFGPALEKIQAYSDDERVSELRYEILTTEQLQQGQPERAVEILEAALQHHPQSEPLLSALATARNEAIESLCRQARVHLNNQEFGPALEKLQAYGDDERLSELRYEILAAEQLQHGQPERAVEILEAALQQHPQSEPLLSALATARNEAIESLCREARIHLNNQEFGPALEKVQAYGDDERVSELRREILAAEQLQQGQPGRAIEILEAALQHHPQSEPLLTALATARNEAIESLCREARVHLNNQEFGPALEKVQAYGDDERLSELRQEILATEQLQQGQPGRAIEILEAALQQHPQSEPLLAALATARNEAIESLCRETRVYINSQEFGPALQKVEHGFQAYGGDQRFSELRDAILSAREIQDALTEAREQVEQGQPERAVQVLEAALQQHPYNELLLADLSTAWQALEAKRRNEAIDSLCRETVVYINSQEFSPALEKVAHGFQTYGDDQRLTELRDVILSAREIHEALTESAQQLEQDQPETAVQILEAALQQYSDNEQLLSALAAARAALDAKQRNEAIESLCRETRVYLNSQEFIPALEKVEHGFQTYGDDHRLGELRDVALSAKAAWERDVAIGNIVEQSSAYMHNGDPEAAIGVLETGLAQYPDERQLVNALSDIRDSLELKQRENTITRLTRRARRCFRNRNFDDAIEVINEGLRSYPGEKRLCTLRDTVVAAKTEWERAENIGQALTIAAELRREYRFVEALNVLNHCLQNYPDDRRLLQLQTDIQADWKRAERCEAGRSVIRDCEQLIENGNPERAVEVLQAAFREYADEPQIMEGLRAVQQNLETRAMERAIEQACREARVRIETHDFIPALQILDEGLETYGADNRLTQMRETVISRQAEWERAEATRSQFENEAPVAHAVVETRVQQHLLDTTTETPVLESASVATAQTAAAPVPVIEPAGAPANDGYRKPPRADTGESQKRLPFYKQPWFQRAAAGVSVIVVAVVATWVLTSRKGTVALQVRSSPSTTLIRITDHTCTGPECRFDLQRGEYQLEASADGFEPVVQKITVDPRTPAAPISITLKPLSAAVQVATNFTDGQVAIDGRDVGRLQDGQFSAEGMTPGPHRIRVSGGDGSAAVLQFATDYGKLPVVDRLSSDNADAIAVGVFGNQAVISSTSRNANVTIDNRHAGKLENGRMNLTDVSGGTHQLKLVGDGVERNVTFVADKAPAITVSVTSKRNFGVLVVETTEDGATVFIDGQRSPRLTSRGQLRLSLEAKPHTIRVAKNGFRAEPADFRGNLSQGGELRAQFKLLPEVARLNISGHIPGASVFLDATPIGITDSNGTFSAQVPLGEHRVGLRKQGYTATELRRLFTAGRTIIVTRADAPLAPEAAAAKPVVPPPPPQLTSPAAQPDPSTVELAEWHRVAKSQTPANLEEFLKKYPNGPYSQEAVRTLERIRWDGVDKKNRGALQEYLKHYPNGTYSSQAASEIARIDRETANEEHRQQELQSVGAERALIRATLRSYADAYGRKDADQLAALRPGLSANEVRQLKDFFRDFRSVRLELRPTAEPNIAGTTATVPCTRITDAVDRNGSHAKQDDLVVKLSKKNGKWVIDAMQ